VYVGVELGHSPQRENIDLGWGNWEGCRFVVYYVGLSGRNSEQCAAFIFRLEDGDLIEMTWIYSNCSI
jgi:hypothetical protein